MPDNLGYTAGSGSTVATDDIAGIHYQRVKPAVGADGTAVDVSADNPMPVAAYGELLEAIESLRFAVSALTKTIGFAMPNTSGQLLMEARQATAANLNATVSGTVTANIGTGTLAGLTNLTQVGGYSANDHIPTLMHIQIDGLRQNISVT